MSFFIPVVLTLLLSLSVLAAGQDFDCNCSPAEYTFRLKLDSFTCGFNPDLGPGVINWFCSPNDPPVEITFARFTIRDPASNIIGGQTFEDLSLVDGDFLPSFTSPNTKTPLVKKIALNLQGFTADGSITGGYWSITFTNECGVLALQEGAEFGFVTFVSLFVHIGIVLYRFVQKLTDTPPFCLCCCYSPHDSKILNVPHKTYALGKPLSRLLCRQRQAPSLSLTLTQRRARSANAQGTASRERMEEGASFKLKLLPRPPLRMLSRVEVFLLS